MQSAVLKEFDFLMEVSRPGPLVIPLAPPAPELPPEQMVPPSPQPVVEFPEDEVQLVIIVVCGLISIALTIEKKFLEKYCKRYRKKCQYKSFFNNSGI